MTLLVCFINEALFYKEEGSKTTNKIIILRKTFYY